MVLELFGCEIVERGGLEKKSTGGFRSSILSVGATGCIPPKIQVRTGSHLAYRSPLSGMLATRTL